MAVFLRAYKRTSRKDNSMVSFAGGVAGGTVDGDQDNAYIEH